MGGREGSHMKTEAEAGGTTPQAKECQGPPETGQGRKDLLLEPWEGLQPWQHLELLRPGLRGTNFCCFKACCL